MQTPPILFNSLYVLNERASEGNTFVDWPLLRENFICLHNSGHRSTKTVRTVKKLKVKF
jgi:hypothetical protein